jgi:hypothetical protein
LGQQDEADKVGKGEASGCAGKERVHRGSVGKISETTNKEGVDRLRLLRMVGHYRTCEGKEARARKDVRAAIRYEVG